MPGLDGTELVAAHEGAAPGAGRRRDHERRRREDRRRGDEARRDRLPAEAARPHRARARPRGHPAAPPAARGARAADGREPRVHGRLLALRAGPRPVLDALHRAARRPHRRGLLPRDARPRRRAVARARGRPRPPAARRRRAAWCGSTRSRRSSRSRRCRPSLAPLAEPLRHSFFAGGAEEPEEGGEAADGPSAALWVPLRRGDALLGVARLTDRLDGGEFGDAQRAVAEKFAVFAAQALDNALRFASLERRSFRDPVTRAYTRAYFDDVVAQRDPQGGALRPHLLAARLELDGLGELRARASEAEFVAWVESLRVPGRPRAARHRPARRRVRQPLLRAAARDRRARRRGAEAPHPRGHRALGSAGAPSSPPSAPSCCSAPPPSRPTAPSSRRLWSVLEGRVDEDRASLVRSLELEAMPFRGLVDALLAEGSPAGPRPASR